MQQGAYMRKAIALFFTIICCTGTAFSMKSRFFKLANNIHNILKDPNTDREKKDENIINMLAIEKCFTSKDSFPHVKSEIKRSNLLHRATLYCLTETVKYLIEDYNCDVNVLDAKTGGTPLWTAIRAGYARMAAYLISKGAEPYEICKTTGRKTIPLKSIKAHHQKIKKTLQELHEDKQIFSIMDTERLYYCCMHDGNETPAYISSSPSASIIDKKITFFALYEKTLATIIRRHDTNT